MTPAKSKSVEAPISRAEYDRLYNMVRNLGTDVANLRSSVQRAWDELSAGGKPIKPECPNSYEIIITEPNGSQFRYFTTSRMPFTLPTFHTQVKVTRRNWRGKVITDYVWRELTLSECQFTMEPR